MLMEYSKEIDSMARADRFLYEASRYHNTRAYSDPEQTV